MQLTSWIAVAVIVLTVAALVKKMGCPNDAFMFWPLSLLYRTETS
ncbi:hypothetical protein [Parasutterella excrementihominis]